jgi:dipeptidyl aminopeptidase/acylaminoacyl peptidase
MTFLDVQELRSIGGFAPSPDGRWLLHTLTTPNWKEARSQSDIHLVPLDRGVADARRMTFTLDRNETSPVWAPDGGWFTFLSNREANGENGANQLYLMRPDGGEARRVTQVPGGVSGQVFTPDGRWIIVRGGRAGEQQLHRIATAGLLAGGAEPRVEPLTSHPGGVLEWALSPDGTRVYFTGPDSVDTADRKRRDERFTVTVANAETPLASLWVAGVDSVTVTRLTQDPAYTVQRFNVSGDGRWIAFTGISSNRYERNITEQSINGDAYLLDVATGAIERLTDNREVAESTPSFSPDGRWIAFSASADMSGYNMRNQRIWIRPVGERGGAFRRMGDRFDGDLSVDFWSEDGNLIYFNEGLRATRQLFALDLRTDEVRPLTSLPAALTVSRDDPSGVVLVQYQDPTSPQTLYAVPSLARVGDRSRWIQLTDANPQVRGFALGETREVNWTSTDGSTVGGVLTLPVGYQAGERYPLIVAIHGGPAAADVLSFNGGYGAQIYAGSGYAVLMPNYRGSTNYGEAHRTGIVGNYFAPGYEDIISGVDDLIALGIVDPDRMGMLGWSAGGHWSNWTLVQTDRFKAISSGAGTSNWISMYAQSDVQRNRQFYLGDDLPYDNFDAYWEQSPLRLIRQARTPTMIHVVQGDPRVPSPQSVELHMALKKIGVPTELFLYPGDTHGIPDPRNRLVKSVSEKAWMDHYVRGIGDLFSWRDVLQTLEESPPASPLPAAAPEGR